MDTGEQTFEQVHVQDAEQAIEGAPLDAVVETPQPQAQPHIQQLQSQQQTQAPQEQQTQTPQQQQAQEVVQNAYQQPWVQPDPNQYWQGYSMPEQDAGFVSSSVSAYRFSQPSATPLVETKDHVAAGLLAIFLGALGIHKFYLGYNTSGFIMLGVTILGSLLTLGLAGAVMGVIGLVEGIIYLTKSQSAFEAEYLFAKKEWF